MCRETKIIDSAESGGMDTLDEDVDTMTGCRTTPNKMCDRVEKPELAQQGPDVTRD